MRLLIMALLAAVLAPEVARAQPQIVRAEATTQTVDCAGNDAQLEGNRNVVTFTNGCRSLLLRGEANTVRVELAPGARIDIEGNGNRVRYTLPGGSQPPSVRVSGSNTDLAPDGAASGAPPAVPQPVALTGDDQRLEVDCAGRAVDIQGNRSRYTLRGGCQSVSIHGDGNTVAAELRGDATVAIEGNGTALTYTVVGAGGEPKVDVRGNNSRATRTQQTAEAAPATPVAPVAPVAPPAAEAGGPGPATHSDAPPSVPQLMHDLDGKVVAQGTLVELPSEELFGSTADVLQPDATTRLILLAHLVEQIHPSAIRVSARAPDAALAGRQSKAVQAWLSANGGPQPPVRTEASAGAARLEVLLLR